MAKKIESDIPFEALVIQELNNLKNDINTARTESKQEHSALKSEVEFVKNNTNIIKERVDKLESRATFFGSISGAVTSVGAILVSWFLGGPR